MLGPVFDLQGHRGARGLRPENSLPSFEAALDAGVTSLEADIHLTRDRVPVLIHDGAVPLDVCRAVPIGQLSLHELRAYRADKIQCPDAFPDQDAAITPLAERFAAARQLDPYAVPTLADLFAFCEAYAGDLGRQLGKTAAQRQRAEQVWFELELKRLPFRECPANGARDHQGADLERAVIEGVQRAAMTHRTRVRSFDHRAVAAIGRLKPGLATAVLVTGTAPVAPAALARQAGAGTYCPEVEFLDQSQVLQLHAAGVRVVPWTVNHSDDWQRLLDWGVDGITTDFPDRLAQLLRQRSVPF